MVHDPHGGGGSKEPADQSGSGDGWNLEVDDSHLIELRDTFRSLRDALSDCQKPDEAVTACGSEMRSAGFSFGQALGVLAYRFASQSGSLRGDCVRLADGIEGLEVDFADVESSSISASATIAGAFTRINGVVADGAQSMGATAADTERGISRLKGIW